MNWIKLFIVSITLLASTSSHAKNVIHLTDPDQIASATQTYEQFQQASQATRTCANGDREKATQCICDNKHLWKLSETQTRIMLEENPNWQEDVLIDVQQGMSGFAFSAAALQSAYNRVNNTQCDNALQVE